MFFMLTYGMEIWILILSAVTGWIAAIIGVVTVIPQCVLLYKTKDSASISTWMYILFFIGCFFWTIWAFGYLFQLLAMYDFEVTNNIVPNISLTMIYVINIPILLLNINGLFVSAYVLLHKYMNITGAKSMNITEREFGQLKLEKSKLEKNISSKFKIKSMATIILGSIASLSLLALIASGTFFAIQSQEVTSHSYQPVWVLVINIIATVIWTCVLIPQSYKTIKTKDTYSLSIWYFLAYPFNAMLWIISSSILLAATGSINNVGVIITDSIGLCLSLMIVWVKLSNMHHAKKFNISELEYYNLYLKNKKENKTIIKFESFFKKIFIIRPKCCNRKKDSCEDIKKSEV